MAKDVQLIEVCGRFRYAFTERVLQPLHKSNVERVEKVAESNVATRYDRGEGARV